MNILVVTPYIPYPPTFGGAIRIYHLMRQLSRRHSLVLLSYDTSDTGGDAQGISPVCSAANAIPYAEGSKRAMQLRSLVSPHSFQRLSHRRPEMVRALDQVLRQHDIDLILVEFSQMACLPFPPDVPVVIDQHNVEFDLIRRIAERGSVSFRKLYNQIETAKYRREELAALRASTLTVATSARDAELMESLVPGLRTAVVENGVDTEFFRNPGRSPKPNTLVFVGATHYFPNEDGIHFYMREIHPRVLREIPDLTVTFVGGRPPPSIRQYESPNVVVTGFVDDVRTYIHEAAAFIVPLRMGGGTRFKVVEALAAETPVVSTRLGSEGIHVTHERDVLLADSPEDFARATVRVLQDRTLADTLRENGLRFVREHFDWTVIGDKLNRALEESVAHA